MMDLKVGCSGWQYTEWKNQFYPDSIPKSRWFEHYCQYFNSVEINYSYYHFPSLRTMDKWYQQAPADFTYALKVNKAIIYKKLMGSERMLQDFYQLTEQLGEKLGPLLFQFPARISYDEDLLKRIIEQVDTTKVNVVEFRHPSWWQSSVYNEFAKHGIIFCSVNAPLLPVDLVSNHHSVYLRFHGKQRWFQGHYSNTELEQYAHQLKLLKLKQAWIYFNNTMDMSAVDNALFLLKVLKNL